MLMVPDSAGLITNVKSTISDFNQRYFRNQPVEVKASIWDSKTQVILIRLFQTKDLAMAYYDTFKNNKATSKA
ncbi:MAG: hypothetical protein IPI95_17390 [Flavobacteriales bacterium]|nr:hypothetical protein [Flavobacteriales bacterium]